MNPHEDSWYEYGATLGLSAIKYDRYFRNYTKSGGNSTKQTPGYRRHKAKVTARNRQRRKDNRKRKQANRRR